MTAPKRTSGDAPIGWFAQQGVDAVCDGDAPVIAGNKDNLIRILPIHNKDSDDFQIHPTTAADISTTSCVHTGVSTSGVWFTRGSMQAGKPSLATTAGQSAALHAGCHRQQDAAKLYDPGTIGAAVRRPN